MAAKLGGDGDDLVSDINITPFVDIVLVVLIIFMVTASAIVRQAIEVKLPEASTGATAEETSLAITIDAGFRWYLDGEPTTDPASFFEGQPHGAVLPFGEHKGWGLALACELLAGALSGGGTQHHPKRREAIVNNMFSVLVKPEALGTAEAFFPQMDAFLEWVRLPPPGRDPTVQIAGEPERRSRAERVAAGIPVDATTWEQILAAGESVGLARSALATEAGVA